MSISVEYQIAIEGKKMTIFKNFKIILATLVIAFSVGACGGSSGGTTTTVTGLATADNAQLLND